MIMASRIKILPEDLVSKIAAGEIIERPASVVKELVENAVDADSTIVTVDITNAGKRMIRIADNGIGMNHEDALLALERHATSKIGKEADLDSILSFGFRGEALPSIAAVSRLRLVTADNDATGGTVVYSEGGRVLKVEEVGCPRGTTVEVGNLFFNTPARLKFLKSNNTELRHITDAIISHALPHPSLHFILRHNSKEVYSLPVVKDCGERILQVWGKEVYEYLWRIGEKASGISVEGFISKPTCTRADRTLQFFFINRRPIRNNSLTHALYEGYKTLLPRERHPIGIIFIEMDPSLVDVNVHPTKREVRFKDQTSVHDLLVKIIREGMKGRAEMSYDKVNTGLLNVEERVPSLPVGQTVADGGRQGRGQTGDIRPLGQIQNTFIVAEVKGELCIIDQHAAHERVLYERIKKATSGSAPPVQPLLIPEQIELSFQEALLLKEEVETLRSFGIELEEFGQNTFILRGIPSFLGQIGYRQLIRDILDALLLEERPKTHDKMEKLIHLMACHSAVKAGQPLTVREMADLIQDLDSASLPFTCPHGRPTAITYSISDLERMFKRR